MPTVSNTTTIHALASELNATTVIPLLISRLLPDDCPATLEEFVVSYDKAPRSLLFQSSQLLILLATLVPLGWYCSSLTHALLGSAYFMMTAWLYYGPCYQVAVPNLIYWAGLFSIANYVRAAFLFYSSFQGTVRRDLRGVYKKLFEPLGVSPATFRTLMEKSRVEQLEDGEQYAVEKMTKIDRLSILVTGRIVVSSGGQFLHSIYPSEFLDSPEWESISTPRRQAKSRSSSITAYTQPQGNSGSSSGAKISSSPATHFNISLAATTPSSIVYWNREDLQKLLNEHFHLAALMSVILARDITNKLYQMNSRLSSLSAQKSTEIDIRLPVIITSFRRPAPSASHQPANSTTTAANQQALQLQQQSHSQGANSGNSVGSVSTSKLKNQSSFGGETSSTSIAIESRSNSIVGRRLPAENNNNSLEAFELQSKQRRKSEQNILLQNNQQNQQELSSILSSPSSQQQNSNNHSYHHHAVHYPSLGVVTNSTNHRSPSSPLHHHSHHHHYSTQIHDHSDDSTSIPLLSTPNGDYSPLVL